MVKVLIYSSKEIYKKSSYEGRAEAHVIAYRVDDYCYQVVKNRLAGRDLPWTSKKDLELFGEIPTWRLRKHIEKLENLK